jgi:hypothetical protein
MSARVSQMNLALQGWLGWMLANITAFVVTKAAYSATASVFGWESAPFGVCIAFVLSVGFLQGLAIRLYLPGIPIRQWWLATVTGQVVAGGAVLWLAFHLAEQDPYPILTPDQYAPVGGLLIGAGVGSAQAWVLRTHLREGAVWLWLPANMAAWAASAVLVQTNLFVSLAGPQAADLTEYLKAILIGVILATSTGVVIHVTRLNKHELSGA